MPRATEANGRLAILQHCKIITVCGTVCFRILPDITDSKSAVYSHETIIGRSNPVVVFSHSEPRQINAELHFMIMTCQDVGENLRNLNIIRSLVYPGGPEVDVPYTPPPVSKFKCGHLLDGPDGLCVILKSYSVRFPTDVAWDDNDPNGLTPTYLPYRFTISTNWEVVYACKDLPSNQLICKNLVDPFSSSSWCTPSKGLL